MLDFLERTDLKERALAENGVTQSDESDDLLEVRLCRSYLFGLIVTPGIMFDNGSIFKFRLGLEIAKWNFCETVVNYNLEGTRQFVAYEKGISRSLIRIDANGKFNSTGDTSINNYQAIGDDTKHLFAFVFGGEILVPINKTFDIAITGNFRNYAGCNEAEVILTDKDDDTKKISLTKDRAQHYGFDAGIKLYINF